MIEPPNIPPDNLWRRLAEAQDLAIATGRAAQPAGRPEGAAMAAVRRSRRIRPAVLLVGALAAAAVVVLVRHMPESGGWSQGRDASGGSSRVVLTDARSDLPLQFSDGSSLTFRAGSAGEMRRLGEAGADVVLDRGSLDAHVVHADSTLWLIHAGPFKVRVTGTRFTVRWSPRPSHLEVAVYQGSVVIDGAALGAGVPLGAGHRLTVEGEVVRTDALVRSVAAAASPAPTSARNPVGPEPASAVDRPGEPSGDSAGALPSETGSAEAAVEAPGEAPAAATAPGSHDGDWIPLARRGAYREALSTAKRVGWGGLCVRLDARRLLMLGDVARYAGSPLDAERAFGSLVSRYPTHRLAGDALFSLGRLAFESGRPGKAARWFRRYVDDWPSGPFVDQALGRLMESAVRAEDPASARSAAETYLARAPHGPHAPLAHEVLEGPSHRQP